FAVPPYKQYVGARPNMEPQAGPLPLSKVVRREPRRAIMPEADITEIRGPRETFAIKRTPPRPNMAWIPGGIFLMGSNRHHPAEGPAHRVLVDGFWLDQYAVTNEDFARFVDETGYVTAAERPPRAEDYPGADPALLVPGSAVFRKPPRAADARDCLRWWV